MGNCSCCSFQTTHVATAKLVVHDGTLHEFSYPVKVSYLLHLYPSCFVCDSDEMRFDDVVTPVRDDHELRLGHLYFALPLNRLKRRFSPQEMAALAVKASSALSKSAAAGDKCGFRRKQIRLFFSEGNAKPCRRVVPEIGGAADTVDNRSRRGSSKGRGNFKAMLSSIPE